MAVTPKNIIVFLVVLLLVAAGAGGSYLADRLYLRPMRQQQQMIANLKTVVERLSKTERLADVMVLEQTQNPLRTRFRFMEVNEKGEKIGEPKEFTVDGNEVYFDALVIKFEDHYKPGDELKLSEAEFSKELAHKSLILFRRVFSDKQKPESGFPLDTPGQAPSVYNGKTPPTAFEQKLWSEFWELANNPELAHERGVYAAHGEALYTQLKPHMIYTIEQRLTGGLTLRTERVRDILQPAGK